MLTRQSKAHRVANRTHFNSAVIDIALAVAAEGRALAEIADALHVLDRENDEMLWAAMAELARAVGESDRDGQTWTWAVRQRNLICDRASRARNARQQEHKRRATQDHQGELDFQTGRDESS